jgi:hypothetical protein
LGGKHGLTLATLTHDKHMRQNLSLFKGVNVKAKNAFGFGLTNHFIEVTHSSFILSVFLQFARDFLQFINAQDF